MCRSKKIRKKVIELFEEKVCQIPLYLRDEKQSYKPSLVERELLTKAIRTEYPDLRFCNTETLMCLEEFASRIEQELKKKESFFQTGLDIIRQVSGHPEYTLESRLFEDTIPHSEGTCRLSEAANHFIRCNKVFSALARGLSLQAYYPNSVALELAPNLRALIDIYYRKGRF